MKESIADDFNRTCHFASTLNGALHQPLLDHLIQAALWTTRMGVDQTRSVRSR